MNFSYRPVHFIKFAVHCHAHCISHPYSTSWEIDLKQMCLKV